MKKPNVLIIVDEEDAGLLDIQRQSEHWNLLWQTIDYNRLYRNIGELQNLVAKHKIDFVVYSRNDQVANRVGIGAVTRKLRTGYSSFSGIDNKSRIAQMVECFNDFMECGRKLDFNLKRKKVELTENNTGGTFSLIFDTEQLGGVKYGLPRILNLLNGYDVKATFSVTNLVKKVYPDILEIVKGQGHEVGIHGLWHEYLAGLSQEEQKTQLRIMIEDFGIEIYGANFLGRMDNATILALVDNKLKYFVYPNINYYNLFSYSKLSTIPSLIRLPEGDIGALPISAETYGSPWFSIKYMIDLAIAQSKKCEFQHITILCHPFRDGNLQHIETMGKLLHYLSQKGLVSITLGELAHQLPESKNVRQTYELGEFFKPTKTNLSLRWLSPPRTKQDFMSLIPQNLMRLYRIFRRGHTVF